MIQHLLGSVYPFWLFRQLNELYQRIHVMMMKHSRCSLLWSSCSEIFFFKVVLVVPLNCWNVLQIQDIFLVSGEPRSPYFYCAFCSHDFHSVVVHNSKYTDALLVKNDLLLSSGISLKRLSKATIPASFQSWSKAPSTVLSFALSDQLYALTPDDTA